MRQSLVSFTLSLSIGAAVAAQQPIGAADRDAAAIRMALERAIKSYEVFQVETAVKLLDSVLTRRDLLTRADAARAHKYRGAGSAVMAQNGLAVDHYVEALKLDATTDLEPAKFGPTERGPFVVARQMWLAGLPSDSAAKSKQSPPTGALRIGSAGPETEFYVNGVSQGPIASSPVFWRVPAGTPIIISIRSAKCSVPWDTTLTVQVGQQITIGRRAPANCTR